MYYTHLLSAVFAAVVLSSPTPQTVESASIDPPKEIMLKGGKAIVLPSHEKRDIQLAGGSWAKVSDAHDDDSLAARLTKRGADKISSCGPKSGWIPVEDRGEYMYQAMWGYRSAVSAFCSRVSNAMNVDGSFGPLVVAAQSRISVTIRWQDDSQNVKDDLRGNRVGLKGEQPGHVEFEVNNKRDKGASNDYTMNEENCKTYLMHMAATNQGCYGPNNRDTKGGTWQMEDNKLTFHALPASDAEDVNTPPHDGLRA